MTDNFTPGYYTCDNAFIDHYQFAVGPSAAAVYQTLCRHCDRGGKCYPSLERLCRLTGLRPRTVQTCLRILARHHLIAVHPRSREGDKRGSSFEVLTPPRAIDPLKDESDRKAPLAAPKDRAARDEDGAARRSKIAPLDGQDGAASGARSMYLTNPGKGGSGPTSETLPTEGHPDASWRVLARPLAVRWAERQSLRPGGLPADPADLVEPEIAELLRCGLPERWLVEEIDRPTRDTWEYWSSFRGRARRSLGAFRANQTRKLAQTSPAEEKPRLTQAEWLLMRPQLSRMGLLPSLAPGAGDVQ